jgi:hypothetical protein
LGVLDLLDTSDVVTGDECAERRAAMFEQI